MKSKFKGVMLGICIPIFVLAAIFVFISVYYSGHFYPGTWINGVHCTNRTATSVIQEFEDHGQEFSMRVMERNGQVEMLDGDQVGYVATYDGVRGVKQAQGMWNWIPAFWNVEFYTIKSNPGFDEGKLKDTIANLRAVKGPGVIPPRDAYIDYTDGVHIYEEVKGTTLDTDKVYDVIAEAIRSGAHRVDLDSTGCYAEPKLTLQSESFQQELKPVQEILDTVINIHLGGDDYVTIDGSMSYKWLYINEEKKLDVSLEKIRSFVKDLDDRYGTYGSDHKFFTSTGEEVVVSGGYYGWSIDVEAETEKILDALKSHRSEDREMTFDQEAQSWGGNEIGDTYVEISIDNQHMWFYKGGELLVETDVVTGCVAEGHNTPTGTYSLLRKEVKQILVGEDYQSPVDYWCPFIGNAYGLHDSSWRSSYGGKIYQTNGSHGCVNTPVAKMKQIYENIEVGTPIILW